MSEFGAVEFKLPSLREELIKYVRKASEEEGRPLSFTEATQCIDVMRRMFLEAWG
ncbi:hypothetical protein EM20IM_06080 [Candidatus Methylacidiphilum infernorum]|uniref:Uncharacterized protein n=1 Tax=Candidatus Methylacidiphilum infernorum TaxID=511746 RepID=A0ABX7PTX7_9BACT|nr:hypothetical protein [Candidatus Methylacidiphilum infernorum]QSR86079.1 hypothetical protein EM20IM_06080 [Candidatus Methylacidiphilum infernorum]